MGEVVSSLMMLMVTVAILGGFSVLSLQSIKNASSFLSQGSRQDAKAAGLLLTIVSTQANSTGYYVWIFNYGWESGSLSSVYLNGGMLNGWTSNCSPLNQKTMCVLHLPSGTSGELTILFGERSIGLNL